MAALTPQQIAQKWASNLQNAAASIKAGVQAVTVAPGQAAVASQQKMVNNFNAAVQSGKWAANTQAVSLQSWQNSMLTTGLQNLQTGVQKGMPKQVAFQTAFQPFLANVKQQVRSMPNATPADREQRMLANARLIGQFRKPAGS